MFADGLAQQVARVAARHHPPVSRPTTTVRWSQTTSAWTTWASANAGCRASWVSASIMAATVPASAPVQTAATIDAASTRVSLPKVVPMPSGWTR